MNGGEEMKLNSILDTTMTALLFAGLFLVLVLHIVLLLAAINWLVGTM